MDNKDVQDAYQTIAAAIHMAANKDLPIGLGSGETWVRIDRAMELVGQALEKYYGDDLTGTTDSTGSSDSDAAESD